jgi:hypothetical protein
MARIKNRFSVPITKKQYFHDIQILECELASPLVAEDGKNCYSVNNSLQWPEVLLKGLGFKVFARLESSPGFSSNFVLK